MGGGEPDTISCSLVAEFGTCAVRRTSISTGAELGDKRATMEWVAGGPFSRPEHAGDDINSHVVLVASTRRTAARRRYPLCGIYVDRAADYVFEKRRWLGS